MKLSELERYIDETAPSDCNLHFFDASDRSFSTAHSDFIAADVLESRKLYRVNEITLSFRAVSEGGVLIRKEQLLSWLRELEGTYSAKVQVRIRLHNANGTSRANYRDFLTDEMWSHINYRGEGSYELIELKKPKYSLGDMLADSQHWEKVAYFGVGS